LRVRPIGAVRALRCSGCGPGHASFLCGGGRVSAPGRRASLVLPFWGGAGGSVTMRRKQDFHKTTKASKAGGGFSLFRRGEAAPGRGEPDRAGPPGAGWCDRLHKSMSCRNDFTKSPAQAGPTRSARRVDARIGG
jgi:hypothetical protein